MLTNKMKKVLLRVLREESELMSRRGRKLSPVHYTIPMRARYRRVLDQYVEDGMIGVIRQGMDCDCTAYVYEHVRPAFKGAVAFLQEEFAHQESLDGPESTRWLKPSEVKPRHESRDLALEAYENGHAHRVSWSPSMFG